MRGHGWPWAAGGACCARRCIKVRLTVCISRCHLFDIHQCRAAPASRISRAKGNLSTRDRTMAAPAHFKTLAQIHRYFGGRDITCLLCRKKFRRLASHLAFKHGITASAYKQRFGLPWSRGLTSATSHANSGWDAKRRAKATRLARRTKFFRFAPQAPRRASPPWMKEQFIRNLGKRSEGFGRRFEHKVRTLFEKGYVDAQIAKALGVNRMTINLRTRRWRNGKRRTATTARKRATRAR